MGICGSAPATEVDHQQVEAQSEPGSPARSNQVAPSKESQAVAAAARGNTSLKDNPTSAQPTGDGVDSNHTPRGPAEANGKPSAQAAAAPARDVPPRGPNSAGSDEEMPKQLEPRGHRKMPQPSMSTRSLMIEAAARQSGQGNRTFLFRCRRSDGMGRVVSQSKAVTELLARDREKRLGGKGVVRDEGDDLAAKMLADLQSAMKARKEGREGEVAAESKPQANSTLNDAEAVQDVIVTAEKIVLEAEAEARREEAYGGVLGAGDAAPGGSSGRESTGVRMYLLHTFEPATQRTRALLLTNAHGSATVRQQLRQLAEAAAPKEGGTGEGEQLHPQADRQGEAGSSSTLTASLRGLVPSGLLAPEAEHVLVRHLCEARVGFAETAWAQEQEQEDAKGEAAEVLAAARVAADRGRGALCLAPVLTRGVSLDGGFVVEGRCEGASVVFRLQAVVQPGEGAGAGSTVSSEAVPRFEPTVLPVEEAVDAVVGSGAGTAGAGRIDTWADSRLVPLLLRATERIRVVAGGDGGAMKLELVPLRAADGAADAGEKGERGAGATKKVSAEVPEDPADAEDAPQPAGHVLARAARSAPLRVEVACSKALRQVMAAARGADRAAVLAALGEEAVPEDDEGGSQWGLGGGGKMLRLTAQQGTLPGGDAAGGGLRLYVLVAFDPASAGERRLVLSADPTLSSHGSGHSASGGMQAGKESGSAEELGRGFVSLRGQVPQELLALEREADLLRLLCELGVCQAGALHAWRRSSGREGAAEDPPADPGRLVLCPLVAHGLSKAEGEGPARFVVQAVASGGSVEVRPLARLARGPDGAVGQVELVQAGVGVEPARVSLEEVHAAVGTGTSAASEQGGGLGLAMVDVLVRACARVQVREDGGVVRGAWAP